MSWKQHLKSLRAAERRIEREAHKKLRDLQRLEKELARLSEAEQARLEVEASENKVEVLISIHKDAEAPKDWMALACAASPLLPKTDWHYELMEQLSWLATPQSQRSSLESILAEARSLDHKEFLEKNKAYADEREEVEYLQTLAGRILAGDKDAYLEALDDFNAVSEIGEFGSSVQFVVRNQNLVECTLKVCGTDVIPTQTKSLTATGKVSANNMPRARFHEIYQDHVCSCVLRIAREVFSLLPLNTVLVTAYVEGTDGATGASCDQAVQSTVFDRTKFQELQHDRLDPSEAVEGFLHRGDFKASRRSGAFQPIVPISYAELTDSGTAALGLEELQAQLRVVADRIGGKLKESSDTEPKATLPEGEA